LSTDWGFEEEFRTKSNCKVICYDHTVDGVFWLRKIASDLTGFVAGKQRFKWSKIRYMFKFFEYKRFFNGLEAIHHQLKVGYDDCGSSVSIRTILKTVTTKKVVLKIDIEGWEYRVMDDLVNASDNVLGFVMELHDIDIHRDRISSFIEKLRSFKLVHIHANNIGGIDPVGDPIVIEVTFARSTLIESTPERDRDYPINDLDFPNDPSKPDIPLKFG